MRFDESMFNKYYNNAYECNLLKIKNLDNKK